jgi:hypothetical protein
MCVQKEMIPPPCRSPHSVLLDLEKDKLMHSLEGLRGGPQRRPRIWTLLVVSVLIALIAEPIVMYRTLVREKEQRRAAAELTVPAKAERAPVIK